MWQAKACPRKPQDLLRGAALAWHRHRHHYPWPCHHCCYHHRLYINILIIIRLKQVFSSLSTRPPWQSTCWGCWPPSRRPARLSPCRPASGWSWPAPPSSCQAQPGDDDVDNDDDDDNDNDDSNDDDNDDDGNDNDGEDDDDDLELLRLFDEICHLLLGLGSSHLDNEMLAS